MNMLRKTAAAAVLAAAVAATPAMAYESGDFIVRLGGTVVAPDDDADCFDGATAAALGSCLEPGVKSDASLGIILGYMLTKNIGLQLLGAAPFNHQITAELDGAGLGVVAKTKHLPPTLTVNWHFSGLGSVVPYVGAGVNYTHFFNENTTGVLDDLGVKDINLSDSWGAAGVVGFDWVFEDDFMFNATVYYMQIRPEAWIGSGVGNSDVDVDPFVVFAGLGKKF